MSRRLAIGIRLAACRLLRWLGAPVVVSADVVLEAFRHAEEHHHEGVRQEEHFMSVLAELAGLVKPNQQGGTVATSRTSECA